MRDVLGGDLFSHRHSITREGRVLEVRGAQVSDTGRYSCTARNLAGETEKTTDIAVHGRFSILKYILTNQNV